MGIEVKGEFFELKKELTLNYVDEGGEIGSYIGVFGSQKSIKNFILR